MNASLPRDPLSIAYDNRARVPEHPKIFAGWAASSIHARATMNCRLDCPYGPGPLETLDIFPARKGDGSAMLFIHGGYWRSFDKQDFSFLAPAWVDAGISLVVVNHALCPAVTIDEIVRQMLRATAWLFRHAEEHGMDEERLFVSGHSSGAHLAAMMMAALWPVYESDLPKNLLKGALLVSGLYDLRPLADVDFLREDLSLDDETAGRLSPALLPPASRAPVATCVGGLESPAYLDQNRLLRERWRGVAGEDIILQQANHFTVLDAMASRGSALIEGARRLMKLDR